ncbi:MAG TPA: aroma-sacti cluster domain-containing protein [Acidobacteriaceae bacterium]|nr:aroma-sacti cluster domain-containing protein [Acidobacteriaceae bacterium]
MNNLQRLQSAGLIEVKHSLTPDEINSINQLSSAEVDALISVRAKLGDNFFNHKVPVGDSHRMGTMIL